MSDPLASPGSLTWIGAQMGAWRLHQREAHLGASDGFLYNPRLDAGTTDLRQGDVLVGQAWVGQDGDELIECMLLDLNEYPDVAPNTPGSGAVTMGPSSGAAYADEADFRANARARLGLSEGEPASFVRARVRQYRVADPGALAASVAEAPGGDRGANALVGSNAQGQRRQGWVYVEAPVTQGTSTVLRQIHQMVPGDLRMAPNGLVRLETAARPSSLSELVRAEAKQGWQYARCRSAQSLVRSVAELRAAALPDWPEDPAGVGGWSGGGVFLTTGVVTDKGGAALAIPAVDPPPGPEHFGTSLDDRRTWPVRIEILSDIIDNVRDLRLVLESAGLRPSRVNLEGTARERWYSALDEASKHEGGLERLVRAAREHVPDAPGWKRWP